MKDDSQSEKSPELEEEIFSSEKLLDSSDSTQPSDSTKERPNPAESQEWETSWVSDKETSAYNEVSIDMERAKVKRYKDEHTTRISLVEKLFVLTCMWLIFTAIIIFGVGLGDIQLSDKVLITILSTTTVEVLGYLTVVLLYLFNKDGAPVSNLDINAKNGSQS
ncbi:MAG: hypothetical protein COA32_09685 [Fluviicola sp.]|nr:MAG: hypothetical protein COA32_09685 [Fluviicola sp.]